MKFSIILSISILLLIPFSASFGENGSYVKAEEELFFTYVGLTFGAGIDKIEYSDWFAEDDKRDTKNLSGSYYCGGVVLDIFVHQFIGEFSIEYIKNSNGEVSVSHYIYHAAGKYAYGISPLVSITAGLGVYMETPPANRDYTSGGGVCTLIGTVLSLTRELKIILDVTGRYGTFGIGEDSTRYSYGGKLGVVYKVGRI